MTAAVRTERLTQRYEPLAEGLQRGSLALLPGGALLFAAAAGASRRRDVRMG